MLNFPRLSRTFLIALAAATAATAVAASTASAETRLSVWLNEQTGTLAITGTETNDVANVFKQPSANTPGGYVLTTIVKNSAPPEPSGNCLIGGTYGSWLVTCPALNVNKISFDGKLGGDGFINNTGLPSEAHGGPGLDEFHGGTGPDVFYGEDDNDILDGKIGDDTLDGASGVDQITGGPGADTLAAGFGDDVLRGDGGNDTLQVGTPANGADVVDGGADSDTLSYAGYPGSVYVYQDGAANDGTLGEGDNVTSIENLTGSVSGDDLEGTPGDDVIHGGDGFDKIDAKFGDDVVYGGDGPDNLIGGPGAPTECGNLGCTKFDTDKFFGGSGSDTIDYSSRGENLTIALNGSTASGGSMEKDSLTSIEEANGGSGNDTIYGNDAPNSLTGGAGTDGIAGFKGNDYLSGGAGNDFLDGGADNDYVEGGADNDTLIGLGGNDTLWGGSGRDLVSYNGAGVGVVARIGTGTSGPTGETDSIKGDVEDLQGTIHADTLYGNGAANHLTGLDGPDTLVGNGGADTLEGNAGADTLNTNGDAVQDHSDCGANADIANADKIDSVNVNCETVNKT
jgi:Ca2+-binding RTX toxin-like protein